MRFRDPKTMRVYDTISLAVSAFCRGKLCIDCAFPVFSPVGCINFYLDNPEEAVRIMGYELIAEDAGEAKAVEKDPKPLAEWIGSGKECTACVLHDRVNTKICVFNTAPRHLSFAPEQPRFTDEEKTAASILYKAGIRSVERIDYENSDIKAHGESNGRSWRVWSLPPSMFPSIQPGQPVELTEIMGSDDHADR